MVSGPDPHILDAAVKERDPNAFNNNTPQNREKTVPKLFDELAQRYAHRSGGYTRVLHFGHRKGDHAPKAILELVDNPHDLRYHMCARVVGRELARVMKTKPKKEIDIMEWATATTPYTSKPAIYDSLDEWTQRNLRKALRFIHYQSTANANTASETSVPVEEPAASTSAASSSEGDAEATTARTPEEAKKAMTQNHLSTHLTFRKFDELARESFLRTMAMSKVPLWGPDLDKYEQLMLVAEEQIPRVPVTVPGFGKKLWAGQEDFDLRYDTQDIEKMDLNKKKRQRSAERDLLKQSRAETAAENPAEDGEWEDIIEASRMSEEERRTERERYMKKKMRHPGGRNGKQGQRSAIARAKGHLAPPRSRAERSRRLDLPSMSR